MSASRSSRSRGTRSIDPASTLPTTATAKSKKSTAYDRDFDLHLTEHLVHPVYSSQEPDLKEVMAAVAVPRPSLSPSQFSDSAFKAFRASNARAKDEDEVLADVMPTILGPSQASRYCARNTVFTNLDPLTDDTIAAPKPDIYYGAYPEQLARSTRNEIAGHILPSTMLNKPMAPNFFIEVKGPDGKPAVATRQARYDGAIGSRAMHSLQNYGVEEPEYDGKAHAFSSTYHAGTGTLQLYAHHVTAPTIEGGRPEYHMTEVNGWQMTGNRDTFVEGARALRNTLDLSERCRSDFIRAANVRAQITAGQERTTAEIQPLEDSIDELAPSPPRYTSQTRHELAFSPPGYLYEGDDSQDPSAVDPPTSLTTSFASSFDPHQGRPKRQRSPRSDAVEGYTSKARSRSTREAESPTTPIGLVVGGTGESFQVWTYRKKGELYFLNMQEQEIKTEARDWTEQVMDDGSKRFHWQSPKSGRVFWTTRLAVNPRKRRGNN